MAEQELTDAAAAKELDHKETTPIDSGQQEGTDEEAQSSRRLLSNEEAQAAEEGVATSVQ